MMRSIVLGALCVWRVAKTRWPVSAAVSAVVIVSRSRISPRRITSGSWRNAPRSPSAKPVASPADLPLVDDAEPVRVQELDRVLDGDDVLSARRVDLVDQRRQRRGLARAGRARQDHETARLRRELVEGRRQTELLERADVRRDHAESSRKRLALVVGTDTEPAETSHAVREVELTVELQILLLLGRRDPVDELACEVRVEYGEVGERLDVPVYANSRMRARSHVQVRRLELDRALEKRVDRERGRWTANRRRRAGLARRMWGSSSPRGGLSAASAHGLRVRQRSLVPASSASWRCDAASGPALPPHVPQDEGRHHPEITRSGEELGRLLCRFSACGTPPSTPKGAFHAVHR